MRSMFICDFKCKLLKNYKGPFTLRAELSEAAGTIAERSGEVVHMQAED